MSHYDVIVIGAGIQGLVAAKTFLQCNPSINLCLIDSGTSIGGVWKKELIYPGLLTNNERGTFEFADFPMTDDIGVKQGEHIPGSAVHEYLQRYAQKHDLNKRCRLNASLKKAERTSGGWKLSCYFNKDSKSFTLECTKLVVATGITSAPAVVELPGSDTFQRPIVKFASLAAESSKLLNDPSIRHVTVLGGGKASFDSVYFFASQGKRVTWIIRASGRGPTWMSYSRARLGPVKLWLERVITCRFVTFLSPSILGPADGFGGIRSLLHNTRLGRWVVKAFFQKLSFETLSQSGLLRDDKLKPLIPDDNAIWYGAGLSFLNYPIDIHEFIVNGQVQVLRKNIARLGAPNTIHFSQSETPSLQTDALICSTGWSYVLPFEVHPQELHASLGIPSLHYTKTQKEVWTTYEAQADIEICQRFPLLLEGPRLDQAPLIVKEELLPDQASRDVKKLDQLQPWRLWRGIAPPGLVNAPVEERNVVFLGMIHSLQAVLRSEISALWAYGWMYGTIDAASSFALSSSARPPEDLKALIVKGSKSSDSIATGSNIRDQPSSVARSTNDTTSIFYDTTLFNRFWKWRCPYGYGSRFPDFVFDGLPYNDLLLRDLGVRYWRKGRSALGEMFSSGYLPRDYRGLVEEWKRKNAK